MKGAFGENNLKNNLQAAFIIYPKQPVEIGDSWTNQTHFDTQIASVALKSTFTLNNITGNDYEITGKADILSDKPTDFKHSGTAYMRVLFLHGTYEYKIKINKATGWIREVQTIKHVEGNAELKHNTTDANGLVFPTIIDGVTEAKGW